MPKVSVVVPVFDTAKYLAECLDSLLAQTLRDIEILCVDDGSTDESPAILRRYAEADRRVRVFTQANQGLSVARNLALDAAEGTYAAFCDSDDKLVPNALETLVRKADPDRLDVLFFCGKSFFETDSLCAEYARFKVQYEDSSDLSGARTGPVLFRELVARKEFRPSVCLQFVRIDHLRRNGIRFFNGIVHEDNLFTFLNVLLAERGARTNDVLYLRRVRKDSIMTQSPRFARVRGYAVCAREMFAFLRTRTFAPGVVEACADTIRHEVSSACRIFRQLPPEERDRIERESPLDVAWISAIVNPERETHIDALRNQLDKARKLAQRWKTEALRRKAETDGVRRSLSFRLGFALLAVPRLAGRIFRRGPEAK